MKSSCESPWTKVEEGDRPRGFELLEAAVGCAPGDAWVGLDLGADNAVEKVWTGVDGLMTGDWGDLGMGQNLVPL